MYFSFKKGGTRLEYQIEKPTNPFCENEMDSAIAAGSGGGTRKWEEKTNRKEKLEKEKKKMRLI